MSLSPWQLCFQADLKCRVKACSNRRIVGGAGDSPYCRYHVCTVCFKFRTCSSSKRGHGEEKICHHHGCIHHDCKEPRSSSKKGSSPYCSKHGCNVKGCDQPRHGHGRCCKRHTCRGRGCVNCTVYHHHDDGPDDDDGGDDGGSSDNSNSNPSSSSSSPPTYCRGHQVCDVRGCESFVLLDEACHRAARFCHRHFCAASPRCAQARVDGAGASVNGGGACRDHSCGLYPACAKPRADIARSLFCKEHECREGGCVKQRYESGGGDGMTMTGGGGGGGGPWCADHMCMAALARREDCEARREGSARNPVFCADHEPCEETGCGEFRAVRGRGARLARCEEHLAAKPAKCAVPHCALDAEGGGAVACRLHVCHVVGCLATASALSTLFCDAHRCAEAGCANSHVAAAAMTSPAQPPAGGGMAAGFGSGGGGGGMYYCVEHSFRLQMRQQHPHRHRHCRSSNNCRHETPFGGDGFCGTCSCGRHGSDGSDDDDDDDGCSDNTVTDHGGSSGGGGGGGGSVEVEIGGCFCCGSVSDGCSGGKKHHHKLTKC
ncbi:hypothetical protein F4820DRAFT_442824 [Hypoxylon rubiginosum]|uniref:Uncharacterized protein n=1 Tax=Hypoxylon rubiginosum TaxID=110542 RepID=A0ACB9ZFE4_9PEZI|nr:hypothetical protein F4820DRAFT_442824 [Hypoxylon rubiginosum]